MNEVMSRAAQVLHEVWGYSAFRGPQAEIIEHVANGGDALVLLPTGGKSLCYPLPALARSTSSTSLPRGWRKLERYGEPILRVLRENAA